MEDFMNGINKDVNEIYLKFFDTVDEPHKKLRVSKNLKISNLIKFRKISP